MVKNVSKIEFRSYLDEIGFPNKIDSDGDVSVIFNADNDFGHDVYMFFRFSEENQGKISAFAVAPDFKINDDEVAHLLIKCNEWNANSSIGIAYCVNKQPRISNVVFTDEPVSESFLKENFIKLTLQSFWKFFCSLVN